MKTSEKAKICIIAYRDQILSLCVPSWRPKKSQVRTCINSRMLSTSVASPCQTLRKLIAWKLPVNTYSLPNQSMSGTTHAQCAEGLHFSAFLFFNPSFVHLHADGKIKSIFCMSSGLAHQEGAKLILKSNMEDDLITWKM